MSEAFCFLDTSVFLECTYFADIDWPQLVGAQQVWLIVASPVMGELDEKRRDTRQRTRDRAKTVVRRMADAGDALWSPAGFLLRSGVVMRALTSDPDMSSYPELDRMIVDNRIIISAGQFGQTQQPVVIYSVDLGFVNKARARGLDARLVPEDFILPDQPDPTSKQIAQLKQRIDNLEQRVPVLDVFLSQGGVADKSARVALTSVQLPTEAEYQRRIDGEKEVLIYSAQQFKGLPAALFGVDQRRIDEYLEEVDKYLKKYREYLETGCRLEYVRGRSFEVTLKLANTGHTAAERVVLQITAPEETLCLTRDTMPKHPSAPTRPQVLRVGGFGRYHTSSGAPLNPTRGIDPRSLLLERQLPSRGPLIHPEDRRSVRFEVDYLVHNVPIELPPFLLTLQPSWHGPEVALSAAIHAGNLPEPVAAELKLAVDVAADPLPCSVMSEADLSVDDKQPESDEGDD